MTSGMKEVRIETLNIIALYNSYSWWTKQSLSRFFSGFFTFSTATNFTPHFLHIVLIHPWDGSSGVVDRHSCYSQTFNKWVSSHLIHRTSPLSDTSWVYLFLTNEELAAWSIVQLICYHQSIDKNRTNDMDRAKYADIFVNSFPHILATNL